MPPTSLLDPILSLIPFIFTRRRDPMANMLSLPVELIHRIYGDLDTQKDVANLRLACRALASIGLEYLAPTVTLALNMESLRRVTAIAAHPVMRYHVHTFVLKTDVLPSYRSFKEWEFYNEQVIWWPHGDAKPRRLARMDPDTMATGWSHYNRALYEQACVFAFLEHGDCLIRMFHGLEHLRHIDIRASSLVSEGLVCSPEFGELFARTLTPASSFLIGHYPVHGEMYGSMAARLVKALAKAAVVGRVPPDSFRFDTLGCCFFDESWPGFDPDLLRAACSDLNALELNLVVADEQDESSWAQAWEVLQAGHLQSFLEFVLPSLEKLSLGLQHSTNSQFIASAEVVFPPESPEATLKTLSLEGLSFEPAYLTHFLASHADTLQELHLANCDLNGGPQSLDLFPAADDDEGESALTQHEGIIARPRWSRFLASLPSTLPCLSRLTLGGVLSVGRCMGSELDSIASVNAEDRAGERLGCSVSDALETLVCSQPFGAFLARKVEEGAVPASAREVMIRDLADNWGRHMGPDTFVPLRHEIYLEQFLAMQAQEEF